MTALFSSSRETSVRCDVRQGVAWITIDGPGTRNALTAESAVALVAVCELIDEDPAVGAAVIRGANATFCSGAARDALNDLSEVTATESYERLSILYGAFQRFGKLSVPTVAWIEGAAVGAGVNLAMAADLRIASPDALFISGFAALGLHPGGGHFHLLARAGGREAAAGLGLFGQRVSGLEAERLGLVWATREIDEFDDTIAGLTGHLGKDPALARALKQSIELTMGAGVWDAAIEVERARQLWSITRRHAR